MRKPSNEILDILKRRQANCVRGQHKNRGALVDVASFTQNVLTDMIVRACEVCGGVVIDIEADSRLMDKSSMTFPQVGLVVKEYLLALADDIPKNLKDLLSEHEVKLNEEFIMFWYSPLINKASHPLRGVSPAEMWSHSLGARLLAEAEVRRRFIRDE